MKIRASLYLIFLFFFCDKAQAQENKNNPIQEDLPLEINEIEPKDTSSFPLKIGVGMSILPLRALWASSENMGLIQLGFMGHLSLRVHPYVDVELGGGILPTVYNTFSNYWTYEAPLLFLARFYPIKRTANPKRFLLSPYLTLGAGLNITQLFDQNSTPLEQALYFETNLGGGMEVHCSKEISLLLELTAFGNARLPSEPDQSTLSPLGNKPPLAKGRVGGQIRFGVVRYF